MGKRAKKSWMDDGDWRSTFWYSNMTMGNRHSQFMAKSTNSPWPWWQTVNVDQRVDQRSEPNAGVLCIFYKAVPQFVSVQLVQISTITIGLWFGGYIELVNGDYKPTNITRRAPPCMLVWLEGISTWKTISPRTLKCRLYGQGSCQVLPRHDARRNCEV